MRFTKHRDQNQTSEFTYEIKPTNFGTLPDDKQMISLGKFFNVLASIHRPVRILMLKEPLEVIMSGESRNLHIPRTYLTSEDPLEQTLQHVGLEYSTVAFCPKWEIHSEHLSYLTLRNNWLAKCYTLYRIPAVLGAAWVHNLLSYSDLVSVRIKPLENHMAVSSINRFVGLVAASLQSNQSAQYKYEKGMELLQALARQETRVLACSLVVMIKAKNSQDLGIADRNFKTAMRTMLSSFEATYTLQRQMLERGIGKPLYFELGSCAIFYPFVSADMIEVPNGIPLGLNLSTMAPVIFDYTQRDNYNILLLATSGAGKSVTAKILLTRLLAKYPTAHAFVVDPNGEYETVADFLHISVIKVTGNKSLGFDPFRLFKPDDAAEIIGDVSRGDNIVRKEFRAKSGNCTSIRDLYNKVDDKAKSYLKDLVTGSIHEILKGDTTLDDRVVLSLRGTSGEERVSMLLLLALGKIWKKINSLPTNIPKILLIDEGWMLFNMSSAGKFLDMMARVGRKFNVIFIFITQRPGDVIENSFGRAIAENAATKIFLQNTEQSSDKIKRAMDLSEQETDAIKTLSRGQGLLLTKDYRLKVQFTPSVEELKVFSTTPTDSSDK